MSDGLRVGIDLVSLDDVRDSVATHGDRWLERVYTDRELADCRTGETLSVAGLALRFAAKEATLKVLPAAGVGVPWRAIEVRGRGGRSLSLELHGVAASLARRCGIGDLRLDVSRAGDHAMAVVLGSGPARGPTHPSAEKA
ncbi:MAG: holo-[acyl-carrier protein] synthase [Solirubrobacteraceae bacterium]|jgi:holo-[acyl-carrier protein] synthase|nr:holo-[acyl-carrier protein] synthase [Solirubrobacteraceae bacterium]